MAAISSKRNEGIRTILTYGTHFDLRVLGHFRLVFIPSNCANVSQYIFFRKRIKTFWPRDIRTF